MHAVRKSSLSATPRVECRTPRNVTNVVRKKPAKNLLIGPLVSLAVFFIYLRPAALFGLAAFHRAILDDDVGQELTSFSVHVGYFRHDEASGAFSRLDQGSKEMAGN